MWMLVCCRGRQAVDGRLVIGAHRQATSIDIVMDLKMLWKTELYKAVLTIVSIYYRPHNKQHTYELVLSTDRRYQ